MSRVWSKYGELLPIVYLTCSNGNREMIRTHMILYANAGKYIKFCCIKFIFTTTTLATDPCEYRWKCPGGQECGRNMVNYYALFT